MSRIGKAPIVLPENVTVDVDASNVVVVKGPKGELKQQIVGRGYQIQRYKGLGEMNPDQLADTTLDPNKRTLIRVTADMAEKMLTDKLINTLMGDDVEGRKKYIQEHADFNKQENYEIKIKED